MSIKAIVLDEIHNIQEYNSKTAYKDDLLKECLKQQQTWEKDQAEEIPLQDKSLNSIHHQQIADVADRPKIEEQIPHVEVRIFNVMIYILPFKFVMTCNCLVFFLNVVWEKEV